MSEPRDWQAELKGFQARLENLGEMEMVEKNQLYCDFEIARMDYCEQTSVAEFLYKYEHLDKKDTTGLATLTGSEQGKRVLGTVAEFDSLRNALRISSEAKFNCLLASLRLVLCLVYICLAMPLMFLVLPLRPLHPLFRSLGVNNNNLPVDMAIKWFARGFLSTAGVTVCYENPNMDKDSNYIAMFQHISNLDPFIVNAASLSFKFVGKKVIAMIPVLGWLAYLQGHVFIDRSNHKKAVESLHAAADKVRNYHRSLAISPEGTRSKTGRLRDFKKGPFHTAKEVDVPILPIVIQGAFELWPPQHFFTVPGTVRARYLDPIPIEPSDTHLTLSSKTRRAMLRGSVQPITGRPQNSLLDMLLLPCFYAALYALYCLW